LELNQEIENLEKELEGEKSKQSENDKLVRIKMIFSVLLLVLLFSEKQLALIWR